MQSVLFRLFHLLIRSFLILSCIILRIAIIIMVGYMEIHHLYLNIHNSREYFIITIIEKEYVEYGKATTENYAHPVHPSFILIDRNPTEKSSCESFFLLYHVQHSLYIRNNAMHSQTQFRKLVAQHSQNYCTHFYINIFPMLCMYDRKKHLHFFHIYI